MSFGKTKRLSFPSSPQLSKIPFDLIHLDIWGPFSHPTHDGFKYFLTIVDDCTRVTWLYLLKDKSSVANIFPEFLQYIQTQYQTHVKAIRSDNALELAFSSLLKEKGIEHYFSCPYTPQQNSVVERKHQHILNVARALLFQSKVPLQYWGECVQTSVYLINRTPSPVLQNKSPFELLTKRVPSYDHLRAFGCLCFSSTLLKDRNKFSPRAEQCVFLGYPHGYKGYKVLNIDTNKISITRNVIFHETVFPFHNISSVSSPLSPDFFDQQVLPLPVPDSPFPAFFDLGSNVSSNIFPDNSSHDSSQHFPNTSSTSPSVILEPSRTNTRSKRQTKTPAYLDEYHCYLLNQIPGIPVHPTHTTSYPISAFLS